MARIQTEKNISKFNQDAKKTFGYLYTTKGKLSSKIANERLSIAVIAIIGNVKNKSVIDVGCGDGTYTFELLKHEPKNILGVDPAIEAIKIANNSIKKYKNIEFKVENIYSLSDLNKKFDIAIVRGVIHHLYEPLKAIVELLKIARTIVIIEPNGYNPLLKLIEKLSPYHRNHEEKSHYPKQLDMWFERHNGKIQKRLYCGLVPFFCPDIIAKLLKIIEPFIEKIPFINKIMCAVYISKISSQ